MSELAFIDGFRDPVVAKVLVEKIQSQARLVDRSVRVMEVCGTHTMAIAKHGIRDILPENVELISGPGCPVCVTDANYIDAALELARQGHIIVSFGDMLRVPGSLKKDQARSLIDVREQGAHIQVGYSPEHAISVAQKNPDKQVIFLAIGFETTIAPVISLLPHAQKAGVENVTLLTAFKQVPPALHALSSDSQVQVNAYLCPAHVSAIIGADAYLPFAEQYHIPCVIAGFEPLDMLLGILHILKQHSNDQAIVENLYERVVTKHGNAIAQTLINQYLEPVDAHWRGIGAIPLSGYRLKEDFKNYDALYRFGIQLGESKPDPGCRCGDVLKGKLIPPQCPLFGKGCRPDQPVGPCMVSSEGTCAAYYKYLR